MIYLYFHAGSANHGCEAIVRSTCSLLGMRPVLISDAPDQDRYYGLEQLADIRGRSRKSWLTATGHHWLWQSVIDAAALPFP